MAAREGAFSSGATLPLTASALDAGAEETFLSDVRCINFNPDNVRRRLDLIVIPGIWWKDDPIDRDLEPIQMP
jgi:hypothetical protein